MTPEQTWSAFRAGLHREIVESLTGPRLREGITPPQEDAAP